MLYISKEVEFDAGHRVPNHKSKCSNPHGHRYKVVATIAGEVVATKGASDEGMVMDFGDLKEILVEHVHDALDHGFIIWEYDYALWGCFGVPTANNWKLIEFPYIPTAENIARWCFDLLAPMIAEMPGEFRLNEITVHETPTSKATYYGPLGGTDDVKII